MSYICFVSLIMTVLMAATSSKPIMQRIVINNHVWEVPNEPGWEEVIQDITSIHNRLINSCSTAAECRKLLKELTAVFSSYPVSQKFLEETKSDSSDVVSSIFKWG